MSNTVIKVTNLSKVFYIGKHLDTDASLVTHTMQALSGPVRRLWKLVHGQQSGAAELDEQFWALTDINFEVRRGEVIGVIGRNGAGKSTLLKILSQIMYPTSGQIELNGRVGSLLEVGTGFHDELTGRENIYLNGTVLGMSHQEIQNKFDEIVEFADVHQFIDTPVKHYSSGMKVRLAFAVAAHLEPEILLVDEVLSVGDAEFQKKSMGKMNDVASSGRTIVFVSHNMGAVNNLCERVVWLHQGKVMQVGPTNEVIANYLTFETSNEARISLEIGDPNIAIVHEVGVQNHERVFSNQLSMLQPFYLWMRFSILQPISSPQVGFGIVSQAYGVTVFATTHSDSLGPAESLPPGHYEASVLIPPHFLNRGLYVVNGRIWGIAAGEARRAIVSAMEVINFSIVDTGSVASSLNDNRGGVVAPLLEWQIQSNKTMAELT